MANHEWGKLKDAPIMKFLESLATVCTKSIELRAARQGLQGLMHLKSLRYSEQKRLDSVRTHMDKAKS